MTTGKRHAEDDVSGNALTFLTTPVTLAVAPSGVTSTDWPFLTVLTSVSSTVAFTMKVLLDWITDLGVRAAGARGR